MVYYKIKLTKIQGSHIFDPDENFQLIFAQCAPPPFESRKSFHFRISEKLENGTTPIFGCYNSGDEDFYLISSALFLFCDIIL